MSKYLGKNRINHKTYKYYFVNKDWPYDEKLAVTDFHECTIKIYDKAAEDELNDRLVHETIHAMLEAYGLRKYLEARNVDEEEFTRLLTPALMGAFDVKVKLSK